MDNERITINVLFESKEDLTSFLKHKIDTWVVEKNHLPNWPLLTGSVDPDKVAEVSSMTGVKTVEEDFEITIPEDETENVEVEDSKSESEGPSIQV